MKAEIGDIIQWNFKETEYLAKVKAITDNPKRYCIYRYFKNYGYTQGKIDPKTVTKVWKT